MQEQQLELEGQILAMRYRLGRCLSRGALGELYQAHDLSQDRACSLKLVHHSASNALKPRRRLAHEAVMLARLSHPNIVLGYELNWDDKRNFFLAMEPLDGVLLQHLLLEAKALPLTLVVEILGAVGSALKYCHDFGVVHKDVSASSIFIEHEYGQSDRQATSSIKLLNFGLSQEIAPNNDPKNDDVHADVRADQLALAKLAFQMLTGRPPTDESTVADTLREVKPQLPEHVVLAIRKALSADRARRFAKIEDFVFAIDGSAQICQRPTREMKREELLGLAEKLTVELPDDLIEPSLPDQPILELEAVPLPLETEETTRKYSTLSMPALLLSSVVQEPHPIVAQQSRSGLWAWPASTPKGPWQWGCVALGLASLALSASLHKLPSPAVQSAAMGPRPALPLLPAASVEPAIFFDERATDLPQAPLRIKQESAPAKAKRRREIDPERPSLNVEDTLLTAQTNYVNGDYREAVARARSVQAQEPVRSWRIIGASACFMKDGSLVKDAYKHLRSNDLAQRLVAYACKVSGMDIR